MSRAPLKLALVMVLLAGAGLWAYDLLTDPHPLAELKQDPLDPFKEPFDGYHAPAVRLPTRAFVPSSRRSPAVIFAVGDGADGGRAARGLVGRIKGFRPDRLLYLGDVYEDGTKDDYRERYAPTYGRLARITAPTPGNHEWPTWGDGYEPYWDRLTGHTPPSFYSFSLAGWQILSLNSEADHGSSSLQLRWLRRQVRAAGTCRLAFWHRPRYSAGTHHGDQRDVEPFWDALAGHAAIVVNGHEHDMQLFRPRRGIVQFVSGAGGHGRYPVRRPYPGLAFADDTDYGALRLELRPGSARFRLVTLRGRALRAGHIRCRKIMTTRAPETASRPT